MYSAVITGFGPLAIFKGVNKPRGCLAFAKECAPVPPLGATMAPVAGICGAYHADERRLCMQERVAESSAVGGGE
jgi:hydrogenase expression/formation protein HypD